MERQEAKKILRELEDKGITLAQIGREIGVTRQYVSDVLKGRFTGFTVRKAIAEKLGWNPWAESGHEKKAV